MTGMETPRDGGLSPTDELRPPSTYSLMGDDDENAERVEGVSKAPSVLDEVVQEVIDEVNAGEQDEEEDVDEDASGGGDEGVTLRDRQDVR